MATGRIPTKIQEFNDYIRNTDDYLQEQVSAGPPPVFNWGRLGLTQQNADDWNSARGIWDGLFALYSNPATRTKTITLQVKNARKDFRTFATPLLNIMAASPNATEDDEVTFNFKISRATPTHPTVPITEQCLPTLQTIGGGEIRLSVRSSTDTQRPSIFAGADSFQVAFKIGEPPPQNPKDGTDREVITRASIVQQTGDENSGKKLYVFVRWYLTSYPDLAGPWSQVVSILIV